MRKVRSVTAIVITFISVVISACPVLAGEVQNITDMKVSSYSSNNSNLSRPWNQGRVFIGYAVSGNELQNEESNWEGPVDSIVLDASVDGEGFTAVRSDASTIHVTGNLVITDDSHGTAVSDFSGVGAAISAANGSDITAESVNFYSRGFCRSFAVVEDSTMKIDDSVITTMGADPFKDSLEGYYNSADTTIMISPPWVLGINGGVRAVNVLGKEPDLVVTDSSITTAGWAVVSTDSGSNPCLYIINSDLNVLPASEGGTDSGWAVLGYDEKAYGSGYGTYVIGGAREYFYGVSVNGATYASILTGGDVYFAAMKAGEEYVMTDEGGNVLGTYLAEDDRISQINGVFGIMAHGFGSVTLGEGTEINTANAAVIYKRADSVWNFAGADVNAGNGILFQMMDNDDTTVGGYAPFGTYLNEKAGFPKDGYKASDRDSQDDGSDGEITSGANRVELYFSDNDYAGSVYNGTGYYGQEGDLLYVDIAETASLTGDIALTSHVHGIMLNGRSAKDLEEAVAEANARHAAVSGYYADTADVEYVFLDGYGQVTEDPAAAAAVQFTRFSIFEYYLIGQVINMVNYNGVSAIDVNVEGEWKVEGASLVTYLNIGEEARVYGEITEFSDGSILITPSEEMLDPGEYGIAAFG